MIKVVFIELLRERSSWRCLDSKGRYISVRDPSWLWAKFIKYDFMSLLAYAFIFNFDILSCIACI